MANSVPNDDKMTSRQPPAVPHRKRSHWTDMEIVTSLTPSQLGVCAAAQDDELDALESIFGPQIFKRDSCGTRSPGAKFLFHTHLPKGKITVKINTPASMKIGSETFEVAHLPPLQFDVLFPASYPDLSKPRYLLKCHWLSPGDLTKVCAKLDDLWNEYEGTPIVYTWVSFLETNLLDFLEMTDELDLLKLAMFQWRMSAPRIANKVWKPDFPGRERGNKMFDVRARTTYLPPQNIAAFLKDFNRSRKRELFEKNYITCPICFSNVCGKNMTTFNPCEHSYCDSCTRTHFITQIKDGCQNGPLTCMEPGCQSEALTDQIRELVGIELFEKYDQILLQRYLSSRSDIIQCPREVCSNPVIIENNCSIATCGICNFSFCLMCRRASHGINPCETQNTGQIASKYINGTPQERAALEKKFSKKYLNAIVNEAQSQEWIQENAKKCPKCSTDIQKSEGCNKMQCWRCRTRFCYLCGRSLEHLANPYMHYNDLTNECNNRLFEGADFLADPEDEIEDLGDEIDFGEFEHIDLAAF